MIDDFGFLRGRLCLALFGAFYTLGLRCVTTFRWSRAGDLHCLNDTTAHCLNVTLFNHASNFTLRSTTMPHFRSRWCLDHPRGITLRVPA